jgi:ABC-2 type transport system ATP-binding protein
MRDLFLSQRGRCTLVVSSHILSELEAVCDHVAILQNGVCLQSGSIEDITGRATEVRIRFVGTLPEDTEGTVEDGWLVLRGEDVVDINARVLPKLLEAGVGILEVRQGRSLEVSYMDRAKS